MKTSAFGWGPFLLAVALAGCNNGTGPGSSVSLSFSSRVPAGATALAPLFSISGALASDTLISGSDVLIVDKAEILLREIELKRQEVATSSCSVTPKPEGCREFKADPVIIDLPLGLGAQPSVTVDIPAGTYTKVEFEVHKLSSGDAKDATLLQQRPDFANTSIRVQGKFNGQAFTYTTDLDVEQEMEFAKPLVISSTTSTNLTIRVVLRDWFKSASGGLVNPATANKGGVNEGLVKENIKKSMKAFEDKDKNGDDRDG